MPNNRKPDWNKILLIAIGVVVGVFVVVALTSKPATEKPAPKIVEFRIGGQNQNKADKSWTVDLQWKTENADKVTIEPMVGKVEPNGSTSVTLSKTAAFLLRAENPGGKAEYNLEIELPNQ